MILLTSLSAHPSGCFAGSTSKGNQGEIDEPAQKDLLGLLGLTVMETSIGIFDNEDG